MSRAPLTVADVEAIFLVKPEDILSITGAPDRLQLCTFTKELRQCAASIPSLKGGGTCGHLAFLMPTAECLLLPGAIGFITQASSGLLACLPGETLVAQRDDSRNMCCQDLCNFHTEQNIQTVLKNILFSKTEKPTHCFLKNPKLGAPTPLSVNSSCTQ